MSKDVFAPSRRLKRNYYIKRLIGGLFIISALLGGTIGFFRIPYFTISSITIDGARTIQKEALQSSVSHFFKQRLLKALPFSNFFIFSFSEEILQASLFKEFPKVKEVRIEKHFPAAVSLFFEERAIKNIVCKENEKGENATGCFYADDTGFLFEQTPKSSGTVFFQIKDRRKNPLSTGQSLTPPEEFQKMAIFQERLEKMTGDKLRVLILTGDALLFYEYITDSGIQILFDEKTDTQLAAENFAVLYPQTLKEIWDKIDYIDLRLENKVFYKLK